MSRKQSLYDFMRATQNKQKILEQAKNMNITKKNLHSIMTNDQVPKEVKDKVNEMLADGGYECLAQI